MNYWKTFIKRIENGIGYADNNFKQGKDKTEIKEIFKEQGVVLPKELVDLYTMHNGEKDNAINSIIGLKLLSIEEILSQIQNFREDNTVFESCNTTRIKSGEIKKQKWIPFAYDGEKGFILADMSPAKSGKKGQVIAINYDNAVSYLMADDMTDFVMKLIYWWDEDCFSFGVNEKGRLCIMEKTGSIFNHIEDYVYNEDINEVQVELNDKFWQEKYGGNVVSSRQLELERGDMFICDATVSCKPLEYADNVKELILHDSHFTDFEYLTKMKNLTSIFIVNCTFEGAGIESLKGCPKLKSLTVRKIADAGSVAELADMKSLKSLKISDGVKNFDLQKISEFTGLTELQLEKSNEECETYEDYSFIGNLKKLKKLRFNNIKCKNFKFLSELKKLESFESFLPVEDETNLNAVKNLPKLQEFIYPVKDIELFRNSNAIKRVGFVPSDAIDYSVFENKNLSSFTLFGIERKIESEELNAIAQKIGEYTKLSSYGIHNYYDNIENDQPV